VVIDFETIKVSWHFHFVLYGLFLLVYYSIDRYISLIRTVIIGVEIPISRIRFCMYWITDILHHIVSLSMTFRIFADRTATKCDWLLASYCRLSVHLSVTLCIIVLRVGVVAWKLYRRVLRRRLPIHFFRHFCCRSSIILSFSRMWGVSSGVYRPARRHGDKPNRRNFRVVTWPWLFLILGYFRRGIFAGSVPQLYRICRT